MRSLMLLLAVMLTASPSQAQSNKTCIAYMEADAAYEDSYRWLEDEIWRKIDRLPSDQREVARLRHSFYRLGKITLDELAIEIGLETELDEIHRTRWNAYIEAYRGPVSSVSSVMTKILRADRKRCQKRFGD